MTTAARSRLPEGHILTRSASSQVVRRVTRARPYALNGSYTMYATTYDLTNTMAYT